jgi:hypothetical protein
MQHSLPSRYVRPHLEAIRITKSHFSLLNPPKLLETLAAGQEYHRSNEQAHIDASRVIASRALRPTVTRP